MTQATWTSPISNKVLLEAGFSRFQYLWAGFGQAPPDALTGLIPVTESQAIDGHRANFTYRGMFDPLGFGWADNDANPNNWRASMSYVTGAHNLKFGYQGSYQRSLQARDANTTLLRYTMNNRVLNGVGYTLASRWEQNDRTATSAFFVQDQWTKGRFTLQGALRYDRASSWAPAEGNGTTEISRFNPAPITFPRTVSVAGYNDITTRLGGAWDVFGTGKTALKANVGKYLQNATNDENYTANNPAARIVQERAAVGGWVDNGNFIVDCDLRNPALQDNRATGGDQCAALTGDNVNFGNANPNLTIVNPAILEGWGVRPSDWQFGVSVQQELLPRLSVDASYNRRWFQNFFVDDNQLVGPSDYTAWTYTAPQHRGSPWRRRLPGHVLFPSCGHRRADLPDLRDGLWPGAHAVLAWRERLAERAAGQRPHVPGRNEHGPRRARYVRDESEPARDALRNGCRRHAAGAGRIVSRDRARHDVLQGARRVHAAQGRRAGQRAVQIAEPEQHRRRRRRLGHQRSIAECQRHSAELAVHARLRAGQPTVQQLLGGRLPGGALANGTTTVNLLTPGQLYPDERLTQVDMRFAKIIRFGSRRADIGVDLYNLFNTNDTTGVRRELRARDQWRDLAAADGDRAAAVRAIQRDVQFLIGKAGALPLHSRGETACAHSPGSSS